MAGRRSAATLALAYPRHAPRGRHDQYRARLFLAIEPQQEVGEADNGAGRPVALSPDGLRQRVIGAMRKRVTVDHQKRAALLVS